MFITNLTKEYIFKTFSQEDIFEKYGCPITNNLFISPIRRDKTPTCKFSWYNGTLIYHDNRPGEFVGDCINFVRRVKNLTYKQALIDIYNTMSNGNNNSYNKTDKSIIKDNKNTTIKLNFKEFTEEDLSYWNSYGISIKTLNYYNVYSVKNCYIKNKEGEYFDCRKKEELCFCYKFSDNSVKIYFPNRGEYRFITNSTVIQGLSQLDSPEYVIITKSLKDIMCLYELGEPSCAPQTESIIPSEVIDTFENTFLLYDNDIAGRKASIKVKQKHNIPILLIPQEYGVKDISDFVKKYGKEECKLLINKTKKIFSHETSNSIIHS